MSDIEREVAAHYRNDDLMARILRGLKATGVEPENATSADLKAADEFHTGGVAATEHLFAQIDLPAGARILDVGSGIGGTSRYLAERYGAEVVGVDLTPEFVDVAGRLSQMVGIGEATTFHCGSALEMPVEDGAFDLAVLLHVGMNIADKGALIAEIARTLKPGGRLALFDVMLDEVDDPLEFPLPWSSVPDTSFVAAPAAYRDAAGAAGLVPEVETDRGDFARAFFREQMAKVQAEGPPPFGINLMMGETAGQKLGNYAKNIEARRIAPVEMIFRKAG